MDTTLWIRVISALVAVTMGFLLAELASYFRRRRDESRENRSIRKLLELERDRNRRLVAKYWSMVKESKTLRLNDQAQYRLAALGKAIIDAPFPRVSREAWANNLSKVARALNPGELEDAWNHYEAVQQLSELRQQIRLAEESSKESARDALSERGSADLALLARTIQFGNTAEQLISQFQVLIEQEVLTMQSPS